MNTSTNPLILSDDDLEHLEHRLDSNPGMTLHPEMARKLVDTAIRARRALASLRTGPVHRSLIHSKALIDFGLGESDREGVHA